MLLYKFFFFNYLFQVTGEEVMDSLLDAKLSHYEVYAKDLYEGNEKKVEQKVADKRNINLILDLVRKLQLILMTLRSRRRNARFDMAIKPFKKPAPKNRDLDLSQVEE